MNDPHPHEPKNSLLGSLLGAGIAMGTGIGTALLAATKTPVRVGVGADGALPANRSQ